MAHRTPTNASVLKQIKRVGEQIATKAAGKQRLALLRRQAELGDQRDEAAKQARRNAK